MRFLFLPKERRADKKASLEDLPRKDEEKKKRKKEGPPSIGPKFELLKATVARK